MGLGGTRGFCVGHVNPEAPTGWPIGLLKDGDIITIDAVATGVGSNTGFLEGSDVKVKDGVVVDDHLQSSVDGIYAAEGPDFSGGRTRAHRGAKHGRR